jgi:nicotinamidase-related amidase
MLKAAKILDILVVATEQNPRALGATVNELDISGNPHVFSKMKFSAFIPEVKDLLEESNIKSVVLFGVESHVCVLQTALEMKALDYDVHVLADAVSSINQFEINIALNRMRQVGVNVTSSESIIFQLLGTAQQEKFKSISTLIKDYKEATATNGLVLGNNRL